jgi:cation:H+ antiporter
MTVGLTLVAVGTSLPELAASLAAVLRGGAAGGELAVGNALGSNVSNIGLLLGLAAALRPLPTGPRHHWRKLLAMTAAAASFAVPAYLWGGVGRVEGAVGLALFLGFIWALFRPRVAAYPATDELDDENPRGFLVVDLILLALGGALVFFGSEVLVLGSVRLAVELGVSAGVIGAALVAVGTSLPELAVCFSAARRGEGEILLGNLIGSNIANLWLVLGAVGLIRPLVIQDQALLIYTPAMLVFTVLMALMVATGKRVGRGEGLLLLLLYAAYQVIVWTR